MKKMLHNALRCLCLCAALTGATSLFAETTVDEDIVKLLKVSGTEQAVEQMVDLMMGQFKPMFPLLSDVFWDVMKKKFQTDEFISMYIPIYKKHFAHDEIKELIKFYESPIGRKMVEKMPAIMQESTAIGQQWGEKIGAEIVKEMHPFQQ